MNKLSSFLELKGKGIFKEKMRYAFNRLKCVHTFIGNTLKENTIADNGREFFHVRKHSIDLHIISGFYEYKVMKVFEKLAKDSKVIVDVGANIGKYTILAGKTNPTAKVIAIEPEKENCKLLNKNIILNDLEISVIEEAVGNKEGEMKMYLNNINNRGHSLSEKFVNETKERKKKYDSSIQVKVNTLDNLFESIDLLKIDIEGFELEVLEGSKRLLAEKKIKKMIIEIDDFNLESIKKLLNKYGYLINKIEDSNYLVELN